MNDILRKFEDGDITLHTHGNINKINEVLSLTGAYNNFNCDMAKRGLMSYGSSLCIRLNRDKKLHYASYTFYFDNNYKIVDIDEALKREMIVVQEEELVDIFK